MTERGSRLDAIQWKLLGKDGEILANFGDDIAPLRIGQKAENSSQLSHQAALYGDEALSTGRRQDNIDGASVVLIALAPHQWRIHRFQAFDQARHCGASQMMIARDIADATLSLVLGQCLQHVKLRRRELMRFKVARQSFFAVGHDIKQS